MSVFDPNTDYTNNSNDPGALYNRVMEVQRVLQEITSLLQVQEDPPKPKAHYPKQEQRPLPDSDSEPEDSPTEQSTIYDNLFD